jgi:hypothetical protein
LNSNSTIEPTLVRLKSRVALQAALASVPDATGVNEAVDGSSGWAGNTSVIS